MLKLLRHPKIQKKIYLFLAVVIVITFGISGVILSQDKHSPASSLGKIHGHSVSVQEYLASYKAIGHQAQLIYGEAYNQVRPYINFKGEAWDRILLLDYAKRQGIKTSDKEVITWIGQQPFFKNKDQFDQRLYELVLERLLQVDARRFEEEVREMLIIGKIHDKIQSRMSVTDEELKTLYGQSFGQRSIRYAVFSAEPQKAAITVTDEELQKIYPMYESRLKDPEKVKIRYVTIPKDQLDTMKQVLADNESGLEELKTKYGLAITDSAYFSRNEKIEGIGLEPKVLEKSFSLQPMEISEWIVTDSGAYKLELLDKKEAHALSYEEAKEVLRKILIHQKSIELTVNETKEISEKIKQDGFDKVLQERKVTIKSFDKLAPDAYIPDIGPAETITRGISTLKVGGISDPIAIPSGAAIIQVVRDEPVDEKKFAEAKEDFRKKILNDRTTKEMEDLINSLRKELVPNLELMKQIFPEEEAPAPQN